MATRNPGSPGSQQSMATTGKEPVTPPMDTQPQRPPEWRDQASALGRKATDGAKQLASSAQSTAQQRIDRSRQDAASTLTSVASTLKSSSSQLRDGDQPMASEYIERAAQQIERVAEYVQNADMGKMMSEVEDFARRRPAVFIGSAFAAGLLAARFLKSSREAESRSDDRRAASMLDREVPSTVVMDSAAPASSDLESWPESS